MNLYDDIYDSSPNLYDDMDGFEESYEPNLYDDIESYDENAAPNLYDGVYDESYEPNLYDGIIDEANQQVKDSARGSRIVSDYNEATEGISLSTKKLLSAGGHNSSDLNAVKPNAEYCDQYDKHFIGDGEDPETSRYNVPAILAARTAGGAPFDQTLNNGINKASADVFHLKKLRDDEGKFSYPNKMNG